MKNLLIIAIALLFGVKNTFADPKIAYGSDKLIIHADVGLNYEILFSPDLSSWHYLDTVTLEKSMQHYIDETIGEELIRFYKFRSLPVKSTDKVIRWAQQITLGPEFGGAGQICSLWAKSPSLSVFGGTTKEYKVVLDTITHLNETLSDTRLKRINMLSRNNSAAKIRVYFSPLEEFPKIAKKHNFTYVKNNWGYFWTFWNSRHEINRAYVLLATDKLEGGMLNHFALEEITQILGLSNDSPFFQGSIFHSGDGKTEKLSELDIKLVKFAYNYITPGMQKRELLELMLKYWADD
tara:strand:+ start:328 stop:1209 length:882 start_codon:yes stop_codon:yes gene_type:complete